MMGTSPPPLTNWLGRVPARVYLLLAVIIFAAANSVTRRLTELGAANLIQGRNPISLCNVLFVGNLCALLVLLPLYHRQLAPAVLRRITPQDWLSLLGVALLSGALAPALIFAALEQTVVNNVILVGRIEPLLALVLAVWFLRAPVNLWIVSGAILSFGGAILAIFLQPSSDPVTVMGGLSIGRGELMTAGGAAAAALAGIISKATLQHVPLGLFNLVRTGLGTVIFFLAAIQLFGVEHFMDIFSPVLWQWMLLYGAVIVVGGQLAWFAGLKRSTASEVSLANAFNPIAGILAAFLILGEIPTSAQYIGGAVICLGIALNYRGILQQQERRADHPVSSASEEMEAEAALGFKGI